MYEDKEQQSHHGMPSPGPYSISLQVLRVIIAPVLTPLSASCRGLHAELHLVLTTYPRTFRSLRYILCRWFVTAHTCTCTSVAALRDAVLFALTAYGKSVRYSFVLSGGKLKHHPFSKRFLAASLAASLSAARVH